MKFFVTILSCLLCSAFTLLISQHVFAMGSFKKPGEKGLFIYSAKEISSFLKTIGYPDSWDTSPWVTLRNSDGTELRFLNNKMGKIIAASCDGSIKEIDIPGSPIWLNDKHETVSWHDQSKGIVHYKNGTYEKISVAFSPHIGPDPSGNYFIKDPIAAPSSSTPLSRSSVTAIYSTKRPDLPLARIKACVISGIFYKDGKVFLFGKDLDEKNKKISDIIKVHIYQVAESDELIETETKAIEPKPPIDNMHVQDFSPWNEKVFLQKDYDPPFRPVLYEFDLRTKEMKQLGKMPFSGGRGFYLQCDIIRNVLEKHEKVSK